MARRVTPDQVRDGVVQLDIHLIKCLLHAQYALREAVFDPAVAKALQGAPHGPCRQTETSRHQAHEM